MIAAATLGSIVGLVAMVLFLIFILRRRRDSEEEVQEVVEEKHQEAEADTEAGNEKQEEENETNPEVDAPAVGQDPEEANGSGSSQLTGKGVAEGYLRSLAALEKKKDPRKIVMLSERSW